MRELWKFLEKKVSPELDSAAEKDGTEQPKEDCLSLHVSCAPGPETRGEDNSNNSDDNDGNS